MTRYLRLFGNQLKSAEKQEPYGLTHVAKCPAGEEETVIAAEYAKRVGPGCKLERIKKSPNNRDYRAV